MVFKVYVNFNLLVCTCILSLITSRQTPHFCLQLLQESYPSLALRSRPRPHRTQMVGVFCVCVALFDVDQAFKHTILMVSEHLLCARHGKCSKCIISWRWPNQLAYAHLQRRVSEACSYSLWTMEPGAHPTSLCLLRLPF